MRLPAVLVRPIAMFFKTRFDVLVTNVPGPPASIDFAGNSVLTSSSPSAGAFLQF